MNSNLHCDLQIESKTSCIHINTFTFYSEKRAAWKKNGKFVIQFNVYSFQLTDFCIHHVVHIVQCTELVWCSAWQPEIGSQQNHLSLSFFFHSSYLWLKFYCSSNVRSCHHIGWRKNKFQLQHINPLHRMHTKHT